MDIEIKWEVGVCHARFSGRSGIMAEMVGRGRDPKSAVGDLCELSGYVNVIVIDDFTPLGSNIPELERILEREKGQLTTA